MSSKFDKFLKEFNASFYQVNNNEEFQEDIQIKVFTDLLYEYDAIHSPINSCRQNGREGNSNWSILGYTTFGNIKIESLKEDAENEEIFNLYSEVQREWTFTIFNGPFDFSLSNETSNTTRRELDTYIKESKQFLINTLKGRHSQDIGAVKELQNDIKVAYNTKSLNKIDLYIITNKQIIEPNLERKIELDEFNLTINIYYFDIVRWGNIKRNKTAKSDVNIDFEDPNFLRYDIPYIAHSTQINIKQYLAFFPGQLIADIYDYFDTNLLENNVRLFLSANRKANKELRETIKTNPEQFFSFNNGLSTTASFVEIKESKIKKIEDFQIVNGGQTTASIHYAWKKERADLSKILIPVKITELSKDKKYSQLVSSISRAANTQSTIKQSDFYTNHTFLTAFEKLSTRSYINSSGGILYCFFERMSGQYNVSLSNSGRTPRLQKVWKAQHPAELSFSKIDLARFYNCMNLLPHVAASSAEKQFELFIREKHYSLPEPSEINFKTIIGFGLIFKRIRQLIGKKNGIQYPPIIEDSSVGMSTAIYSASVFHKLTQNRFSYHKLFDNDLNLTYALTERDRVDTNLDNALIDIIQKVWNLMSKIGGTSVQEQSKKEEFSSRLLEEFDFSIISNELAVHMMNQEDYNLFLASKTLHNESYSEQLQYILECNCQKLTNAIEVCGRSIELKKHSTILKNFHGRILNGQSPLSGEKTRKVFEIIRSLEFTGINLIELAGDIEIPYEMNFNIESLVERALEINTHSNTHVRDIYAILDDYEMNNGFTLNQLIKLTQILNNK
jgi:hypothetical protein